MAVSVTSTYPIVHTGCRGPRPIHRHVREHKLVLPVIAVAEKSDLPGAKTGLTMSGPPASSSSSQMGPSASPPKHESGAVQKRQPSPGNNFQFLTFSHPSEAKALNARRTVRSHVTRHQHQQKDNLAACSFGRRGNCDSSKLRTTSSSASPTPSIQIPMRDNLRRSESHGSRETSMSPSNMISSSQSPMVSKSAITPPWQSRNGYTSLYINPHDLYPSEWQSSIPMIMDNYLTTIAPSIPPLATPPTLHTIWHPAILSSPPLHHAILLLATTHLSFSSDPSPVSPIALRSLALHAINEAIHSPSQRMSDSLVAAMITMAQCEAEVGDEAAYITHMEGLRRLVALRGGLGMLGMDGVLEGMVRWVDGLGGGRSFGDE